MKLCSEPGCTEPAKLKGMCSAHYHAAYRSRPDVREHRSLMRKRQRLEATEVETVPVELTPEQRLHRVRECYNNAVGWQTMLRWKRIVRVVEQEVQCSR